MRTADRSSRSVGIWSVVHAPPEWTGASRWVPKCSSDENEPMAKPSPVVPDLVKARPPDQVGSLSESGWPRSRMRAGGAAWTEAARASKSPIMRRPMLHLRGSRQPAAKFGDQLADVARVLAEVPVQAA